MTFYCKTKNSETCLEFLDEANLQFAFYVLLDQNKNLSFATLPHILVILKTAQNR